MGLAAEYRREIGRAVETRSASSLSGNQLTALPAELAQLSRLQHLDLSGNQLTALPAELTQLSSLQHLHLNGNQLTALPAELAQLASATN